MDPARYFDHAATTPVDPGVLEAMLPFLRGGFGNADSLHAWGAQARAAVERARQQVADLLGAEDPSQIVFTSGATEANNWVLSAFPRVAISPFEHSSLREPALARGHALLPNDGERLLSPTEPVDLLSIMSVNNETGQRWELAEWSSLAYRLHSDITQQLGKLPVDLALLDLASMSAHKIYGPKGVGALYFREMPPEPFLLGGDQELGARAGTLNVAGIVGFGAAAALAQNRIHEDIRHAEHLREVLLNELQGSADWQWNGGKGVSPYIVSLSFHGLQGESIVVDLDTQGFAISAGAACSSRSTEPSHVLLANGVPPDWAQGTVRISFGRSNTEVSTRDLGRALVAATKKLRRMT